MSAPTNTNIYELIERLRLELKADIQSATTALANNQGKLEGKFDTLEAGRLTAAEREISKLKVAEATLNVKVLVLVFIISTTSSALVYALIGKVFAK